MPTIRDPSHKKLTHHHLPVADLPQNVIPMTEAANHSPRRKRTPTCILPSETEAEMAEAKVLMHALETKKLL